MGAMADKYRVQLDFSPEVFAELESLKTESGAASRADTVRYAMRVLRWIIDELKLGSQIMITRDGRTADVVFPFLPKFKSTRTVQKSESATRRIKVPNGSFSIDPLTGEFVSDDGKIKGKVYTHKEKEEESESYGD